MGVFDAIVIRNTPGADSAVIARSAGPLENGRYHEYEGGFVRWVPEGRAPQKVLLATEYPEGGFGVDSLGQPYYDSISVDEGQGKDLWVDPYTGLIWLGDKV